jgi:hypothetical protein
MAKFGDFAGRGTVLLPAHAPSRRDGRYHTVEPFTESLRFREEFLHSIRPKLA